MNTEEVQIFVITEKGEKHLINIKKTINYANLTEMIKNKILKRYHFQIIFKNKRYTDDNKNDILNFNQGDKIYTVLTVIDEANKTNIAFHLNANLDEGDRSVVNVSGILQICLLKYIAKNMSDKEIKKITSNDIKNIISDLQKDVDLTDDPQKDIEANLSETNDNNIITYVNYVKHIVSEKDIRNLISLLDKNKKNQIMNYWSQISKYQTFNELFQETFKKAIEDSYFDYSLIGVSIYQQENRIKFVKDLNKCKNHVVKFLFHGTQIGPIAKIITTGFLYAKKAFYGMGVYFSDMLDYVSFYCGGKTLEERRENFGKTIPVNDTFSCVATEIFYNNDRKKDVYGYNYYVEELDHFPTYEELKEKYSDKMVEKDGIHFAKVESQNAMFLRTQNPLI